MYKHHTNQLLNIFSSYLVGNNYPTRNAQDYCINNNKKTFTDQAIRNCGPMFWNSLDNNVKQCGTTKQFKNMLKTIFISNYK